MADILQPQEQFQEGRIDHASNSSNKTEMAIMALLVLDMRQHSSVDKMHERRNSCSKHEHLNCDCAEYLH